MTTETKVQLDFFVNSNNPVLEPIRDGRVTIRGVEANQLKMLNVIIPFRRLCRNVEFDISELAVVAYFVARRYGLPYKALPVFPANQYSYGGGIIINKNIVKTPKDLEGKKVGMRAHTVTATPWQCGWLADQGVDCSKITFVSNDAEHNGGYHVDAPSNVVYHKGADLTAMLASGELAAAFGINPGDNPDFAQLNPNHAADGVERFKTQHISQVIHLMTIQDHVLEANPWVLQATYDAFKQAKEIYLQEKGPVDPWADPLPMGLDNMRPSLEKLQQLCVDVGILPALQDIDDLFPGNLN